MEFEKLNCFFVDILRYSFKGIKVILTIVEREYIPDITRQICFAYQLIGFYMIWDLTEQYFLTESSYILENHFHFVNAPDYFPKSSLCRIICVNSSVKVLSPRYNFLRSIYFAHHCFARSLFAERKKQVS